MQSINEIYQQYAQTVFKYLMTLTHNVDIAEELTQETFYQAIKSIDCFDQSCKITTWLCAIARNNFLTYQRKHPVMEDIDALAQMDLSVPSAEQDVFVSVDRIEIMKMLHDCPEPYREIIYMRLFGDLSFREIGDVFGKTENWARVSFYRGKERLKKEIEQNEE